MGSREEIINKMGVAFTKGMTPELVRAISAADIDLSDYFEMDTASLSGALGIPARFTPDKLSREEALFAAREEMNFVDQHHIEVYYLCDEDYPELLSEISDPPLVLFKLGEADLNSLPIMNIVGSRRPTQYGANFCKQITSELGAYFPDLTIVSGLAYGIDAMAHSGALENGLTTVAVMAHGLDMIYPAANRDLARRIVKSGGAIVSEYPSKSQPYRKRFLERNRIVAGLSELTLVVESEIKGGAMSTSNLAFSYSREVMAVPGRIGDQMSTGCNHLIRKQKAQIVTCAADIIELMDWRPANIRVTPQQRNLFPELEGDSGAIYEALKRQSDPVSPDELHQLTHIPVSALMSALMDLEFDGIILKHPGNRYSLS